MRFTPPVDLLNGKDETSWGNLGDWAGASAYADAAEALALRLGRAAELGPGQRVIDVGCGAGDQLRLWVDAFDVASVTAFERDEELGRRAAERVAAWGLDGRIRVVVGDAGTERWPEGRVDCVLSLDAVYFVGPRRAFLQRCRTALRPRGTVALTDLLLGEGASSRLARVLGPLCDIPRQSLLDEPGYRTAVASAGFVELLLDDCTTDVLGGFSRWLRTEGLPGDMSSRRGRVGLSMLARSLEGLTRTNGLRYVVATARRAGP